MKKTMLYKNKGALGSCCKFHFSQKQTHKDVFVETTRVRVSSGWNHFLHVWLFVDVPANPQFIFLYSYIQRLKRLPLQVPEFPMNVFE